MQRFPQQQHKGFSLIEVLVSLSIFTIVVTICVTVLYTLIDANARSRNAQSIVTNLSFTLDSVTREIRTGHDYYCTNTLVALPTSGDDVNDCPASSGGGSMLSFNEGGQSLTGDFTSRRIAMRKSVDGKLQQRLSDSSTWIDLTSDGVIIEELKFFVDGTEPASLNYPASPDTEPPIVTVFLSGKIGDEDSNQTDFEIQTTITQYSLDL